MFKNAFSILCLFFLAAGFNANAQVTDSLKRADSLRIVDSLARIDTVKVDTNYLNKYRIDLRRFQLPVVVKPFRVEPNLIPVGMLDYKVSYWRKWIIFGINFNQSAFSNNWSSGGISALALNGNFNYKTEYNKGPFDYTGELMLLYGKSRNSGQGARKTNDRIFFDNKISSRLSKNWYFFGSLSLETQFDKGFIYFDDNITPPVLISNFMSPGYLTESIGFEYKPNKAFDLRLGTGTARQTFVLDNAINPIDPLGLGNRYGVAPGHTVLNELAFQVVSTYDKDIAANMHLNARYALFIPYAGPVANITHRLDAILTAKVNRLIAVTVNGTALYDKKANSKIQGTEGLALGVIYKFP